MGCKEWEPRDGVVQWEVCGMKVAWWEGYCMMGVGHPCMLH